MGVESGEWILRGLKYSDKNCLHSPADLVQKVNEVGFLPLFRNPVPNFSVEEFTVPSHWWCENPELDPWEWRKNAASGHEVVYGKFFGRKAGFVSLDWLPHFANYRRDGYDFDVLWDDAKASFRMKKIMDLFPDNEQLFSCDIKRRAGFGKSGEKNFEGTLTDLEMRFYLTMSDFRCRLNKFGIPYGWSISMYSRPEALWGYDLVTEKYSIKPSKSFEIIMEHALSLYQDTNEVELFKLLK